MKTTKFIILAVLSGLFLGTVTFVGCSGEEQTKANIDGNANFRQVGEKLSEFAAYLEFQGLLGSSIEVDLDRSFTKEIDGIEVLFLVVDNEKDGGVIKGIKTSEQGQEMIPDNNKYLIIYEEFSNFNEEMSSATIDMYDWNYGKQFGHLVIEDSEIIVEEFYSVMSSSSNPCAGGSDGDMSWGECYSCMKISCQQDPTCDSLCDAVNILAGVYAALSANPIMGASSSCYGAMAIACVAIAAMY